MRVYKKEMPRRDIDVRGNRGYLVGTPKPEARPVKRTRQIIVTELELGSPSGSQDAVGDAEDVSVEQDSAVSSSASGESVSYDSGASEDISATDETEEVVADNTVEAQAEPVIEQSAPKFQEYTVQKGDTLQKISFKFYGKYSLWPKIYEANKDLLKSPDSVSVGQVLQVPVLDDSN